MVDVQELLRLDVELKVYVEDVFSSLRRTVFTDRRSAKPALNCDDSKNTCP
jgi:hypothetical protein